MPVALMDILAAHHLKEGILLALLRKYKSGKGDLVEVSLLQAAVASLANQATNWLVAGVVPQKQGSAHPNIAPYGDIFRTADGHDILLAVGSDRQFNSLCKILATEIPELCLTNELRVKNRAILNDLLGQKIEGFELDSLVASLKQANVPYGIVKPMSAVFEAPEVQGLLLRSMDRIGVKTVLGGNFLEVSSHFLPPPHFGEHSREILLQSLAMPAEEVESLIDQRIIS